MPKIYVKGYLVQQLLLFGNRPIDTYTQTHSGPTALPGPLQTPV